MNYINCGPPPPMMPWNYGMYFDFPIIFTIWKMWTVEPYFLVQGFSFEVPPYRTNFGWFTLEGKANAPSQ